MPKRKQNLSKELKNIGEYLDCLKDASEGSLPYEFFSTEDVQSNAFDLMTATLKLIMHQVKYITMPLRGLEVHSG